MDSVAPGARADRQIETFISRRASKNGESRPGEQFANQLEESWRKGETERRAEEERIRRMRLLFSFRRKQELHQNLADEYGQRAQKLIDEDERENA